MKHLYLIRHAETEFGNLNCKDHDRNLTEEGIEQALNLSNFIKENNYTPELILHSSANRVKQTLKPILKNLQNSAKITEDKKLYLPNIEYLIHSIEMIDNEYNSAMIISHNPALANLIHTISNGKTYDYREGSISIIKINCDNWYEASIKNMSLSRIFEA